MHVPHTREANSRRLYSLYCSHPQLLLLHTSRIVLMKLIGMSNGCEAVLSGHWPIRIPFFCSKKKLFILHFYCCCAGWLVGWTVGWLAGWLVNMMYAGPRDHCPECLVGRRLLCKWQERIKCLIGQERWWSYGWPILLRPPATGGKQRHITLSLIEKIPAFN